MIDRQYGNLVFECDSCDATFEAESRDFSEAWDMAKSEGWTVRQLGNDWLHSCNKCRVPK